MTSPTAIITGASTGIGRALALVLARKGYDLGLIARRDDLLKELQEEILQKFPDRRVFTAAVDVTDEEKLAQIFETLVSQLGFLDLFVANAGVGGTTPGWKDCWEETKKIIDINFRGGVHSLELAKQVMLRQKRGHLVGISSIAAVRGLPQSSAYCASKAGLATYLEALRIDLKGKGIAVTCIYPGFIDTPMTKDHRYRPFLISSEESAEKIYRAIRCKKARTFFPWPMTLLYYFLRHLPNRLYDIFLSFGKGGAF